MIISLYLKAYLEQIEQSLANIQVPLRSRRYFNPGLDLEQPLTKEFGSTDFEQAATEFSSITDDWAILVWDRTGPSPDFEGYRLPLRTVTAVDADNVITRKATQGLIDVNTLVVSNSIRVIHKILSWYYVEGHHLKDGVAQVTVDGTTTDFKYSLFDRGVQLEDYAQQFGEKGFLYTIQWSKTMQMALVHPREIEYEKIDDIVVNLWTTDDDDSTEDVLEETLTFDVT